MGGVTGKLTGKQGAEMRQLMQVQRQYVNVDLEKVDFANVTGEKEEDEDDEEEEEGEEQEEAEDVTFSRYQPKTLNIPGTKPHPSPAVENGTLATVDPPAITYDLKIATERPDVVTRGKLSALQLEFVALSCQKHETELPSGARRGFFLGDGAGTGKGRQLAGLVLENYLHGRKKHIWISTSHDLSEDAKRDLRDVGFGKMPVLELPKESKYRLEAKEGVLFSTYSTMSKGCTLSTHGSRIQQILDWVDGDEFDGCLMFDECHRAKNLMNETGSGEPTAAGSAVFAIQRALPKARVVYCSATAVSEPHNYAYMVRLGLWGPSSPFPRPRKAPNQGVSFAGFGNALDDDAMDDEAEFADDDNAVDQNQEPNDENSTLAIKNFIDVVKFRGLGMMELIALHLKQEGALLCRTLSYDGVDFSIVEATLTDEQQLVYDQAARLWQLLYARSEQKLAEYAINLEAYEKAEKNGQEWTGKYKYDAKHYSTLRRTAHSQLWGGHQRFFRSLITAFKVPTVIELAEAALAEDKCVVIGLQSTGEAHTKRAVDKAKAQADEDILDDDQNHNGDSSMLSAPQETLLYVVEKIWEPELAELRERKRQADLDKKRAQDYANRKENEDSDEDSLFADDDEYKKIAKKNPKVVPVVPKKETPKSSTSKKRSRMSMSSQESSIVDLCSDSDDDEAKERAAKMNRKFDFDDDDEMDRMDRDDVRMGYGAPNARKTARAKKYTVEDIVDIDEELEWLEKFIESIHALKLPSNALDEILDKLGGFDKVAEMSGRTSRLVRNFEDEFVYEKRSANGVSMDDQNIHEREEFQNGRKLVAIISDAASAGISLQSDLRAPNQRRRVHITLELPWSADKTLQQMGRSHRTNQKSAPEYKLLVSPLGGERRFVAAVVRRLESLGALTQGDRRATGVTKSWSCFNVDTTEGETTVRDIFHHSHWTVGELLGQCGPNDQEPLVKPPKIHDGEAEAIAKVCIDNEELVGVNLDAGWIGSAGDIDTVAKELHLLHAAKLWLSLVGISVDSYEDASDEKSVGIVSKFLNRILGLEISRQQWLFDYFARYLERTIKAALRDGTLHQGIKATGGRKIQFKAKKELKLTTPAATPIEVLTIHIDKGLHYDDACKKLADAIDADDQSRANRRRKDGAGNTSDIRTQNSPHQQGTRFGERDGFRFGGISGQQAVLIIETGDASMRGLSVKTDEFHIFFPDQPMQKWQWKTINKVYSTDITKGQAKTAWNRAFDNRAVNHPNYILTGPILYIWSEVLKAQMYAQVRTNRDTVRVVRAEEHDSGTATGQVALGVLLDSDKWSNIIKKLEEKKSISDTSLVNALANEKERVAAKKAKFLSDRAKKVHEKRKEKQEAASDY